MNAQQRLDAWERTQPQWPSSFASTKAVNRATFLTKLDMFIDALTNPNTSFSLVVKNFRYYVDSAPMTEEDLSSWRYRPVVDCWKVGQTIVSYRVPS